MSISIVEQTETEKSSQYDEVVHHYAPREVFKCKSGLPYKSSCGITFDPKVQDLGRPVDDLTNMDKCVMCQTVLSQK